MAFFDWLFPRYTEWELVRSVKTKREITKQVEDTRYSGGMGITDSMDVKTIGTGRFVNIVVSTYVRYNKRTGRPQNERIETYQ